MDPASNNLPLAFNMNKNKPPLLRYDDGSGKDDTPSSTTTQGADMQGGAMMPAQDMYGMNMMNMMGPSMDPSSQMNMMGPNMDPNMMMMGPMAMNQYGMMGPMGTMDPSMMNMTMMGPPPEREVITLKSCVLYPPPQNAAPRSVRERPPGCRTIFVGGLPETVTEEILTEVFEKCGNIVNLRISKKNFAHVRFEFQDSVEKALFISGYRMKIDDKDDKANTGRIHVDYANARDDQYEYECQERALMREMRHQERLQQAMLRPPSPPPLTHYTDSEATVLVEKIKGCSNDLEFIDVSNTLVQWIDRGHCNRRSAAVFYSMVQSVNSHVRKLLNEKQQLEEELENMKIRIRMRVQDIIKQFDQIEKVFSAALRQKAWDHFTKAQRKNIDTWYKQCKEIIKIQQDDFLKDRQEDEMDLSDGEGDATPAKKRKADSGTESLNNLKDENDILRCQMEAFKNEVDFVKEESKSVMVEKDKQIKALQNALQGMQQQLINSQRQMKLSEEKALQKEKELRQKDLSSHSLDKETTQENGNDTDNEKTGDNSSDKKDSSTPSASASPTVMIPALTLISTDPIVSSSGISLTQKEARILSLVCCFLHVHPFGATIDYLWSYLNQLVSVRVREVEDVLDKLPSLFQQELKGCGARLERRWVFQGYADAGNAES
ncbi:ecto-NOX disulfide-thiol exchanger 2-like [Gigantopelta aegis]|uniref:ecto-NOX disulfide-thiol exchanger 2-like n=1 Tax=Gigantopelta aegis TaxID=1735272 RepID=UPI001B88C1B3|nr:ecto-NOX disulfide-thiol exchanger 2-like [Gigantopelta aegis]